MTEKKSGTLSTAMKTDSFIGGEWTSGASKKKFSVKNPCSGEEIAQVADLDVHDLRKAISAAKEALQAWKSCTGKVRSKILRRWFELISDNSESLAMMITMEQGKSLTEARSEIDYAASFVEWFSEEAKRTYGDLIPETVSGQKVLVTKEAIGVVGAITPWNFPAAMITRKVAPALAAGCTVVLKPADETPLTALELARLAHEAGIPSGVFNVVTSTDAEGLGEELTSHPAIRKISFTGSTAVGKILMRQASTTLKHLSLELGGNAPFIVFEDADLDAAVAGAMFSKFRNSGQTCVCTNRFLIAEKIYDEFAGRLVEAVSRLVVGDGRLAKTDQGPLINQQALEKVEAHVADAVAHGARVLIGGHRHTLGGTFFEPTVLADVHPKSKLAREETFGPVAGLIRFQTDEEAIRIANDTDVGLAAYFYTRDVVRIWRVSGQLHAGMIGINDGRISNEVAPFGGVKESGMGREGSKYGILDYLETKYILFGGLK